MLFASRAPFINEYVYLVRLRSVADPHYLAHDWSLSGSFGENLVFNTLFTPIARAWSIVVVAWIGRVTCWAALSALLVALTRRLGIARWAGVLAVLVWMPWQLRIVGGDWMFGSFEAKPIAYVAVLGAIIAALDRRVALAMLLGGVVVSAHPGVGVAAMPAIAIALLVDPATRRAAVRALPLAALAAAPGVVGIVRDMHGSAGNRDLWRFIARDIYPFHMDPWYFGGLTLIALVAMACVNTWYAYSLERAHPLRFLAHVELVTAVPSALGLLAWTTGRYEYLRFFPFRVFPIIVSLGFALTVAHAAPRWWQRREITPRPSAVLGAIALTLALGVIAQNPVREAGFLVRRNVRDWTGHNARTDTDLTRAYHWVRDHTPTNAVIIAPPGNDPHYDTERAQIATFGVPRWDEIVEWKRRILQQLGPSDAAARHALDTGTSIDDEYRALTTTRIHSLVTSYNARYLVTDRRYPFTLETHQGSWYVYRLT